MSEAPLWRWDGVRPVVDDDDILHHRGRWVALGPVEARMARELTAHAGELVRRADLERAGWDGEPVRSNTATRQVQRLRAHVEAVGLVLLTVRGHGYVLEVAAGVA